MKYFDWDKKKNIILMKSRNISFEMVVACIEGGFLLDKVKHPNEKDYPNQYIYIVEMDGYAFAVPFIEDKEKIFLKTIIPNRKLTRKYLNK